eukprot:scaffold200219_cov19-Prasinocladus_malaysianus.AAC.2
MTLPPSANCSTLVDATSEDNDDDDDGNIVWTLIVSMSSNRSDSSYRELLPAHDDGQKDEQVPVGYHRPGPYSLDGLLSHDNCVKLSTPIIRSDDGGAMHALSRRPLINPPPTAI